MSVGESIHNYYEKLVREELLERFRGQDAEPDYLADIACVALNRLPPRYFRHEIDMAFYLSPIEHQEMQQKVSAAVTQAIEYVDRSHREAEEGIRVVREPGQSGFVNDPFSLKIPEERELE